MDHLGDAQFLELGVTPWFVSIHMRIPLREVLSWSVYEVIREAQVVQLRLMEVEA